MMKILCVPVLCIFLLSFYSSCCIDSYCKSEVGLQIELINYPSGNYPVKIEHFVKNGNLDSLVRQDTNVISWTSQKNRQSLPLSSNANDEYEHDYRITLLEDSNSFAITNIEIDKNASTRKCGPAKTKEQLICPYKNVDVLGPKASFDGNAILLTK